MVGLEKASMTYTISKSSTHIMGCFIGNTILTGPGFIGEELKRYKQKTLASHSMT